ncbi:MAG: sulfatase-like hydrolase/transferase [Lachnospirales bacterium]
MKKNVLFFLTDDQRFDTIGSLGNNEIYTPNLDRLVSMGTTFTQAHIPSGTSGAICMPSRAMIHSGRTLFHLKDCGAVIPKEHITLGEVLQKNGYNSCGIGKWHNGHESFARSFNDGDDIFFGGMWDHWNVPISHYDHTGKYDNFKKHIRNSGMSKTITNINCDEIPAGVHSTELFTSKALEKLRTIPKDKPFFMYVSYLAPHDPRSMPEEFQNMYDKDNISLPKNFKKDYAFLIGIEDIRDEKIGIYPRDEEDIKQHIADYYAMITHLDFNIGKILDELEAKGILEDTLIIFAGDNGLNVGQHGYLGKQSHYEASLRVPLIMAGANMPKNKKIDSYVYLMDVYPTICQLLDVEIPESVEGLSLVPLINNSQNSVREYLYFAYTGLIRSIKYKGYKLILYKKAEEYNQLFNIATDCNELNNLFNENEYDNIKKELLQLMDKEKEQWEDTKDPYTLEFWK